MAEIVLSYYFISWEYIIVILSFCNHPNWYTLLYTSSISGRLAMSTEEQTVGTEQRINLKVLDRLGKTPSLTYEIQ